MTYVPDHAVSQIPVRFQTEVQLSSASGRDGAETGGATRPASDDADATRPDPPRVDGVADKDWQLLHGQVVNESGAPVGGARVELESSPLAVSADTKGRFWVACLAGSNCIVRIESAGHGRATRIVALKRSLFNMRIALSHGP